MKITVADTAKLLHVPEQFVRVGIQNKRLDIGDCAKLGKKERNYYYVIIPAKLAKYMGISQEELERRVTHLHYEPRQEDGVPNWVHSRNSICSISVE